MGSIIKENGLVYIVIVNWNGWRDTIECIDSLRKLTYSKYRVVVVDNGSTDESISELQTYPYINLITTGKNLGFSGGNNVGIRWAMEQEVEFILLLNNDTVVAPDLLDAFVEVANRHPHVGAMAAKIYYFDQPEVLWFAGGKVTNHLDCPGHLGGGEKDQGQYDQICDTLFINGSAFFARAKAISDVGLLDERYFYTFEDADWTMRFLQAGYRCLYVPQAKIWHKAHRATGGRTPCWWYYYERSRLLWLRTHFPEISLGTALKSSLVSIALEVLASVRTCKRRITSRPCGRFSAEEHKFIFLQPVSISRLGRWLNSWRRWVTKWVAILTGIVDYLRGHYGECPLFVRRLYRD